MGNVIGVWYGGLCLSIKVGEGLPSATPHIYIRCDTFTNSSDQETKTKCIKCTK